MRHGGRYDRILYQDWYPVDVAKNQGEAASSRGELTRSEDLAESSYNAPGQRGTDTTYEMRTLSPSRSAATSTSLRASDSNLQERLLGPRRLCFVDSPATQHQEYVSQEVSEWLEQRQGRGYPKFLFVSYTSFQFVTQSREALQRSMDANNMTEIELEDRLRESATNRRALATLAARVARQYGLDAFWIDFEAGFERGGGSNASDSDAYAICDFVRASAKMIVVVGPPYRSPMADRAGRENLYASRNEWLASWGQRLWTLPELLICPNSGGIAVHTLDGQPPETLSKHTIARMLKDGSSVRELVEHYSGTIQLSPLELTVTATQCLFARPYNTFSAGDASYALMGLMRRRPRVNKADSAFKAFARLSLLNDNDRLLERLICLQPDLHNRQPWYSLYDAYHASLWDIEPCTQVAGIVNAQPAPDPGSQAPSDQPTALDETQIIVLDGAVGAFIQWEKLRPVAFMKRPSNLHKLVRGCIRALLLYLIFGIAVIAVGAHFSSSAAASPYFSADGSSADTGLGSGFLALGLIFFIPSVLAALFSPWIIRRLYAGKFWATQAAFFGIAGIPDLAEVESCIFGFSQERLKWSTHSSTLSAAKIDEDTGELIPQRPADPERKPSSRLQTFTLIDTFTLTATVFEAERVPVAAIICGQEGGMQRALLCSYDPETRAFCKETVLRMKTLCLERMPRIDRFRFAMRRG